MKTSQPTFLLLALAELGAVAFATTAVLTQYPGLINMGAEMGSSKAHILIDGRMIDRPTLPPTK